MFDHLEDLHFQHYSGLCFTLSAAVVNVATFKLQLFIEDFLLYLQNK